MSLELLDFISSEITSRDVKTFRLSDELNWSRLEENKYFQKVLLGHSEGQREIWGFVFGHGNKKVSLLAGCHSDEPVGPEMLRCLIETMHKHSDKLMDLFEEFTFYICPHINPDGESENATWMKKWPNFESYLTSAFRELPGRDVEFGFPSMRQENRLWSEWLKEHGPFDLHISFHGMGYSEGTMLLIERHWIDRTEELRKAFAEKSAELGYLLHDHDRKGDKGFIYIAPGFTTTPEGGAMKDHFLKAGDEAMAAKFHASSMEWMRSLGGDPLCLVTELPLFCIQKREGRQAGLPVHHLSLKAAKQKSDFDCVKIQKDLDIESFPITKGIEMQLFVLKNALQTLK